MSRKIANALPSPWLLPPPKETRHISSAITFAFGCTEPGAMMKTRSKTFSVLMIIVTNTTSSTGESSGTVIFLKTCHSVAPSMRAASSASRGMADRPAAISTIAKPAHTQTNAPMIAGVIRVGPSQVRPLKGASKFDCGSRTV